MDPDSAIEIRIHFFNPENLEIESILNAINVAPVNLRPDYLSSKESFVNELERLPQFPKAYHAIHAGIGIEIECQSHDHSARLAAPNEALFNSNICLPKQDRAAATSDQAEHIEA